MTKKVSQTSNDWFPTIIHGQSLTSFFNQKISIIKKTVTESVYVHLINHNYVLFFCFLTFLLPVRHADVRWVFEKGGWRWIQGVFNKRYTNIFITKGMTFVEVLFLLHDNVMYVNNDFFYKIAINYGICLIYWKVMVDLILFVKKLIPLQTFYKKFYIYF